MTDKLKKLLCIHKWPKVNFGTDEYSMEISCPKCGKTKTVFLVIGKNDRPPMRVLPTDYYGDKVV